VAKEYSSSVRAAAVFDDEQTPLLQVTLPRKLSFAIYMLAEEHMGKSQLLPLETSSNHNVSLVGVGDRTVGVKTIQEVRPIVRNSPYSFFMTIKWRYNMVRLIFKESLANRHCQRDGDCRSINAFEQLSSYCLIITLIFGCATVAQSQKGAEKLKHIRQSPNITISSDEQIRVDTDLVTINLTVSDSQGNHVHGLNKNSFILYDNKVPQQISFFSDTDGPASIAILFDLSGSMKEEKITRAREALAYFIQTSHPMDEFFLIGFDKSPYLLLDKTRDGDAVVNKLTYLQPHGNTALYDAVIFGIEKITHGSHSKRAILLISDGEDNSSRYTFNNIRQRLRESDVIVYTIGISVSYLGKTRLGQTTLKELASITGGRSFFPNDKSNLYESFDHIALDLRSQYLIGYKPIGFLPDGKWHRVKLQVKPIDGRGRLFVRSREGYYAIPKSH
jgi:Ca-activated chloride channel homolog